MKPRVLHDGNFVLIQRENIGLSDEGVVTITSKMKTGWTAEGNWPPDLVLSEDEWKDVQRAAVSDEPKSW